MQRIVPSSIWFSALAGGASVAKTTESASGPANSRVPQQVGHLEGGKSKLQRAKRYNPRKRLSAELKAE
jgi:hypothetical protein